MIKDLLNELGLFFYYKFLTILLKIGVVFFGTFKRIHIFLIPKTKLLEKTCFLVIWFRYIFQFRNIIKHPTFSLIFFPIKLSLKTDISHYYMFEDLWIVELFLSEIFWRGGNFSPVNSIFPSFKQHLLLRQQIRISVFLFRILSENVPLWSSLSVFSQQWIQSKYWQISLYKMYTFTSAADT